MMPIDYEKLYNEMADKNIELMDERSRWWDQLELKMLVEEFERTKKKYGFHPVEVIFEDGKTLNLVYSSVDDKHFNEIDFSKKIVSVRTI